MRNKTVLICLFLVLYHASCRPQAVSSYRTCLGTTSHDGKELLVIRKFLQSGNACFLAVDPSTMDTQVIRTDKLEITAISWHELYQLQPGSAYLQALAYAKKQSVALQDAGIVHGFPKEKGIALTIDLCPSHKPLDRIIFTSLISEFAKIESPVPVALSITGKFMLNHSEDISWLKELETKGGIRITWINHTYSHHYDPKVPILHNFLLEPGTDMNFEILQTEIAMLESGLLPSVFFRFPGLVSDSNIADYVINYGLIPIGSDAWLAKGEQTAQGSIVLIHGNGNEPLGIEDFIKLLKSEKDKVIEKKWLLYDLRESVSREFGNATR